jgi:hypothetical protein
MGALVPLLVDFAGSACVTAAQHRPEGRAVRFRAATIGSGFSRATLPLLRVGTLTAGSVHGDPVLQNPQCFLHLVGAESLLA